MMVLTFGQEGEAHRPDLEYYILAVDMAGEGQPSNTVMVML